jgi:hypothetical protein
MNNFQYESTLNIFKIEKHFKLIDILSFILISVPMLILIYDKMNGMGFFFITIVLWIIFSNIVKILIIKLKRRKLSAFYKHIENLIDKLNKKKITIEILKQYSNHLKKSDSRVKDFIITKNDILINYKNDKTYNKIYYKCNKYGLLLDNRWDIHDFLEKK